MLSVTALMLTMIERLRKHNVMLKNIYPEPNVTLRFIYEHNDDNIDVELSLKDEILRVLKNGYIEREIKSDEFRTLMETADEIADDKFNNIVDEVIVFSAVVAHLIATAPNFESALSLVFAIKSAFTEDIIEQLLDKINTTERNKEAADNTDSSIEQLNEIIDKMRVLNNFQKTQLNIAKFALFALSTTLLYIRNFAIDTFNIIVIIFTIIIYYIIS